MYSYILRSEEHKLLLCNIEKIEVKAHFSKWVYGLCVVFMVIQ